MRFRWEWVLVPAVIVLMAYVLGTVNSACNWPDVMSLMGVSHTGEYTRLGLLAVALVAVTAVLRVIRNNRTGQR